MAFMPWKKKSPMEQRMEFAIKALRTLNSRARWQEYGISIKTGYKWKERFLRNGFEGLEEQSRRPHAHADQLAEEVVCEIVRLKLRHLSWGPRKIRELYFRGHGEVASESSFKRVLERSGLTQKRRRCRATEAGRLHGDISREIEALGHSDQEAFDLWRQSFNYERPHEALSMRSPAELYRASERKYQGTPEDLNYPQMCPRRVSAHGTIKIDNQALFLSKALAGWSVGLKPITEQRMEVWFGRLLVGGSGSSGGKFFSGRY